MSLEWMAWTLPTAVFFISIFLMIGGMLIWELVSPTSERRGFLPISTTRGTRFFIGLLGSAYITIAWIGLSNWNMWYVLPILIVFTALVMRYG